MIRHLGVVVDRNGKEVIILPESRFDSIGMVYPVGNIAVFWKIAEEFQILSCLSNSIGEENATTILLLVMNQLMWRRSLAKMGSWFIKISVALVDQNGSGQADKRSSVISTGFCIYQELGRIPIKIHADTAHLVGIMEGHNRIIPDTCSIRTSQG